MDYPTEALTAAPDARRQVSALYQAHALAPVKLAALARLLKEEDAR